MFLYCSNDSFNFSTINFNTIVLSTKLEDFSFRSSNNSFTIFDEPSSKLNLSNTSLSSFIISSVLIISFISSNNSLFTSLISDNESFILPGPIFFIISNISPNLSFDTSSTLL